MGHSVEMGPTVALLSFFVVLAAGQPAGQKPCCESKEVGGVKYMLTGTMDTKAYGCITNCLYETKAKPDMKFCFAPGDLEVECLDDGSSKPPKGDSTKPPKEENSKPPMDGSSKPPMEGSSKPPMDKTSKPPMGSSSEKPGCKCGKKKDERIVGGAEADVNEWPWMASMTSKDGVSHKCGGTLVASEWIVTAAHCLYEDQELTVETKVEDISIVLGEHDYSMTGEESLPRKVVKVSKYIKHPDYNTVTSEADIALFKLAEKVDINTYTPACMANTGDDYTGKTAWVYGWGALSFGTGDYPDKLQELSVKIVSQAVCQAAHNDLGWTITDGMLCAGGVTGQDSCQGDSGGPLTVDVNGQHHLVGDVSFGDDCAKEGRYGIYAKTAFFREWIDQTFAAEGGATYCPVE